MKNRVYIFTILVLSLTLATFYFKPTNSQKQFYIINKTIPQIPLVEDSYTYQYETDKVIVGKSKKDNSVKCFPKNRWHFIWVKK